MSKTIFSRMIYTARSGLGSHPAFLRELPPHQQFSLQRQLTQLQADIKKPYSSIIIIVNNAHAAITSRLWQIIY